MYVFVHWNVILAISSLSKTVSQNLAYISWDVLINKCVIVYGL